MNSTPQYPFQTRGGQPVGEVFRRGMPDSAGSPVAPSFCGFLRGTSPFELLCLFRHRDHRVARLSTSSREETVKIFMAANDGAPFNSSDVEFEVPSVSKQAAYRGQASIDQLVKHAQSDRLTSKRTVKQLQFGHGAPGTRAKQSLWIRRFNAFRQHTLKQSLDTPFTGDDMLRFFDAIIGTFSCALSTLQQDLPPRSRPVHCRSASQSQRTDLAIPVCLIGDVLKGTIDVRTQC